MITSLQNEQVKHVVSLHHSKGRKDSGEYIIEGKRFVKEALLRRARLKKIYYAGDADDVLHLAHQAETLGFALEEVTANVMKKMSTTEEPQGILAVLDQTAFSWQDVTVQDQTAILVLDGIQDPGNLGTILRTALAADVKQIILTKGTVDLFNPKVLRSSMGAIFSQIILTEKTPEAIGNFCLSHHLSLVVSTMAGDSIFDPQVCVPYPLALVIGNEGFGPSEYFLKNADKWYSLPMANQVESLNAAMAAGIFLYELRRQAQSL
jgi:TrmH family RNA methyltransferase